MGSARYFDDHETADGKEGAGRVTSHEATWAALEEIATAQRLSMSGLARAAGLDPTAFNRSKRAGRWVSLETVDAVLRIADMTWSEFGALVDRKKGEGLDQTP